MKLKHIAAAALAAVSVSSFASIISPTTGNSELFAVVYDSVDQVSYTIDLGVQMDSFNTGSNFTQAIGSANWTSFLSTASTTANTLQFAVFAADSAGGTTAGNPTRLWSTTNNAAAAVTQGNVTTANTTLQNYADAQQSVSLHQTHSTLTNGDSYDSVGNDAYAAGNYNVTTLNINSPTWTAFNDQGTAATFKQWTKTSSSASIAAGTTTFAGVWTLDQTGNTYALNYSAVPDADGLALVLAGLGAMGFVARRRAAR